MDGYKLAYVAHNVPLLVVSGLGAPSQVTAREDEEGYRISSEVAPLDTEDSHKLLRYFRKSDAEGLPWNGREHTGRNKFKIKLIGRVTIY